MQKPRLIDRSQPSFGLFQRHEEHHAHQDHETDRRIGAGKVVALGKFVDELAEPAEIDQEFDADDIDQREDQSQPQADEDRRQGGRKQDLPELLSGIEIETAPNIYQHLAGAGNAFDGLQNHRRQRGDESHHDDGPGAAPEDHQEKRIHQHDRRRGHGRNPSLAGLLQRLEAMHQHAAGDAEHREHDAGGETLGGGEHKAAEHVFFDDHAVEAADDLRGRRHDEAVNDADLDENFDDQEKCRE